MGACLQLDTFLLFLFLSSLPLSLRSLPLTLPFFLPFSLLSCPHPKVCATAPTRPHARGERRPPMMTSQAGTSCVAVRRHISQRKSGRMEERKKEGERERENARKNVSTNTNYSPIISLSLSVSLSLSLSLSPSLFILLSSLLFFFFSLCLSLSLSLCQGP